MLRYHLLKKAVDCSEPSPWIWGFGEHLFKIRDFLFDRVDNLIDSLAVIVVKKGDVRHTISLVGLEIVMRSMTYVKSGNDAAFLIRFLARRCIALR